MDGTIYLGDRLFDCTLPFLRWVKQIGANYLFLTNNSSKSTLAYVKKLARMGIEAKASDFVTSVDATIRHLRIHHAQDRIYALGTASFQAALRGSGLQITDYIEPGIACLVMGFDTELTFQKLKDACILLGEGVDYIATNPDLVCPTEFGYVPDCGSIAQALEHATGRTPKFLGKPQPAMIDFALEKAECAKHDAILVGDRLYTDIAAGVNAGIDTALVLSGETKSGDISGAAQRPTFVISDLSALQVG